MGMRRREPTYAPELAKLGNQQPVIVDIRLDPTETQQLSEDKASNVPRQSRIVFPYHYSPDKKLVHIIASITDDPGALASVLTAVGPRVNLVGTTSYALDGGVAVFSGFGEFLSQSDSGESLRKYILDSRKVIACQVWESKEGLLVDWFHTGMKTPTGEPYIMMPTSGLAKTFDKITETFGTGGETILYLQGKEFTTARFQHFRKLLGSHPEERFDEAQHLFEASGYGSSTISLRDSAKELHLVTRGCFECSVKSETRHSCSYTRGLAAGSFGEAFRKQVVCEEIRCRFRGDDECEFVIRANDGKPLA